VLQAYAASKSRVAPHPARYARHPLPQGGQGCVSTGFMLVNDSVHAQGRSGPKG
jgi:hypothetical protein